MEIVSKEPKNRKAPPLKSINEEVQIRTDVERLSQIAHVYWELYGSALGKKVVNVVGATTFNIIQKALQEALVMGVARLLDPPTTGPHDNMHLELLIQSGRDESNAFKARLNSIKDAVL